MPLHVYNFTLSVKSNISKLIDKLKNKDLVEPLTLPVNQMLKSGHFPSELKISRVKPLFKNSDPVMFSNYR